MIDSKTARTNLNSINKSMAKLDQISQMNWSKKDQNLDMIATVNPVFNNLVQQTSVDPKTFTQGDAGLSKIVGLNSRLSPTPTNNHKHNNSFSY